MHLFFQHHAVVKNALQKGVSPHTMRYFKHTTVKWCARALVILPFLWLLLRATFALAQTPLTPSNRTPGWLSPPPPFPTWGDSAPETRPWAGWLWERVRYANLGGRKQLLFSEYLGRQRPALGDLDGDGDLDLLLGVQSGRVLVFLNIKQGGQPQWEMTNDSLMVTVGTPQSGQPLQVTAMAAPTLGDIDQDGDLDLLVGAHSGALLFFENIGNRLVPEFTLRSHRFAGIHAQSGISPALADINGDGLLDLALGLENGAVWLLHNVGTPSQPRFCPIPAVMQERAPKTLQAAAFCPLPAQKITHNALHASPAWVDWDGDGDLDLLIGNHQGQLLHWRNIGNAQHGVWEKAHDGFRLLRSAGMAAPAFADLNRDGKPDLLLGSAGEYLAFYTNITPSKQSQRTSLNSVALPLHQVNHNVLSLARLGRSGDMLHFSAADLNGDGMLDLALGSRSGALRLLHNQSTPMSLGFSAPQALPTLANPQRRDSHPALGDLDHDGDADLLLGSKNGTLEWIENVGNHHTSSWRVRTTHFAQARTHGSSVPILHDINQDGRLDVVLGDTAGKPVVIRNLHQARFVVDPSLQGLLAQHLFSRQDPPLAWPHRGGQTNPPLGVNLHGALPVVFPAVISHQTKGLTPKTLSRDWLMWLEPNGVIEAGSPVVNVFASTHGLGNMGQGNSPTNNINNPLFYAPAGSKAFIAQLYPKQGPWLLISTPIGGLLGWQAKIPLQPTKTLLAQSPVH